MKNVVISEAIKYYAEYSAEPNDFYLLSARPFFTEITITEENKAEIYCRVFGSNKVVVNGVTYEHKN